MLDLQVVADDRILFETTHADALPRFVWILQTNIDLLNDEIRQLRTLLHDQVMELLRARKAELEADEQTRLALIRRLDEQGLRYVGGAASQSGDVPPDGNKAGGEVVAAPATFQFEALSPTVVQGEAPIHTVEPIGVPSPEALGVPTVTLAVPAQRVRFIGDPKRDFKARGVVDDLIRETHTILDSGKLDSIADAFLRGVVLGYAEQLRDLLIEEVPPDEVPNLHRRGWDLVGRLKGAARAYVVISAAADLPKAAETVLDVLNKVGQAIEAGTDVVN